MKCPVCVCSLVVVERNRIELDYCAQCKGLWFDAGELQLMAYALNNAVSFSEFQSQPTISSPEKPYTCPRCPKKMDKFHPFNNSNIVLDRCPQGHGLWFDANELEQTLELLDTAQQVAPKATLISFLKETFAH